MTSDDDDDGRTELPSGVSVTLLDRDLALVELPLREPRVPDVLTPAETEVALAAFEGHSNKAIAEARAVSPKTVGNQLEAIYRKLGVSSRAELVLLLLGDPVD